MKISTLAVTATAFLHLRGPDDALLYNDEVKTQQVGITLYGPGSRPYAEAQALQQNRAIEKLKKKGKLDQSADSKADEKAEFLTACTAEFHFFGGADDAGSTSKADFHGIYVTPELGWVAQQADQFIGDWANFTPNSATS